MLKIIFPHTHLADNSVVKSMHFSLLTGEEIWWLLPHDTFLSMSILICEVQKGAMCHMICEVQKCVMCHIAHFCTNNNAHSTVLLSIFWTSIHSPFIHYNNLLFMLKQELWFFLHSIKHLFLFLFIWKTQFSTKLQIAPFCTEPSIWPCMSCRIMW